MTRKSNIAKFQLEFQDDTSTTADGEEEDYNNTDANFIIHNRYHDNDEDVNRGTKPFKLQYSDEASIEQSNDTIYRSTTSTSRNTNTTDSSRGKSRHTSNINHHRNGGAGRTTASSTRTTTTTTASLKHSPKREQVESNPDFIPSTTQYLRLPSSFKWWWWCIALGVAILIGIIVGAVTRAGQHQQDKVPYSYPTVDTNTDGATINNNAGGVGSSNGQQDLSDTSTQQSPPNSVEQILREASIHGGTEFDDTTSYQYKALQWLEAFPSASRKNDNMTIQERILQRYALACIYFSTNMIPNAYTDATIDYNIQPLTGWYDETGWLHNDDECTWKGIACNIDGRVREINLSSNNLTGFFPPEVVHVKQSLQVLDLWQNLCYNTGPEGNDFFGELVELRYLYLSQTSFEYVGIPPAFQKLSNLIEFDPSYTLYFGPIDGTIFANMQSLEYLDLSGLSLQHEIPLAFGDLPNLKSFYAVLSDVVGDMTFLRTGSWPTIYEMWLDQNPGLTGEIPSEIGNYETLVSLSITSCDLQGRIPKSLGMLRNMQQMFFYNNSLTGPIPSEIGQLSILGVLEIEMNNLSGTMPAEVCARASDKLHTLESNCDDGVIDCSCCTCCGESCALIDTRYGN